LAHIHLNFNKFAWSDPEARSEPEAKSANISKNSPFQTQVINLGLKTEAISKANFSLDWG
jgi:hypothetical protein